MSFPLFDAPEREPSHFVGFAGNVIDRLSENRSDDCVETALADPACRVMLMRGGRMHLRQENAGFEGYMSVSQAQALAAKLEHAVLLGWDGAVPVLAAPAALEPEALPEGMKAIDYRSIYAQGLLGDDTLGALAQGAALLGWHQTHRFCGRCGGATQMRAGGYKRKCEACGAEHFPRTDPVAIMLAVTKDRCLMGRSPHFAPGMYSCLAGFIEPGETIEAAVRRETFEEAGIRVGRVVYHASQPWPFPYSLMIGCFGEAVSHEIDADRTELEDCRWFTREETRAILSRSHPEGITAPPPMAIAHHLIKAWAEAEG
ncbi:NAD(+) diphosphatase [Aquibium microcysteis]|uniref:NAD(+) diphosphatase n=1 Tax=Aquibium microcysteis TaxID=675281 RepID=UPI00165D0E5E|nr:NAD(+) diphosphatase [Aquibium microcysteis]